MPSCPKCQNETCRKDGFMKGKQRYHCKSCGYRHTVANRGYSEETKRKALQLYLEGLGFRSIGRILNCWHVAVYRWIKQYGEKAQLPIAATEQMDEGHLYIGSKKSLLDMDSRWPIWQTLFKCCRGLTRHGHWTMCLGRRSYITTLTKWWPITGSPIKPFYLLRFIRSPKHKPSLLRGTIVYSGIS